MCESHRHLGTEREYDLGDTAVLEAPARAGRPTVQKKLTGAERREKKRKELEARIAELDKAENVKFEEPSLSDNPPEAASAPSTQQEAGPLPMHIAEARRLLETYRDQIATLTGKQNKQARRDLKARTLKGLTDALRVQQPRAVIAVTRNKLGQFISAEEIDELLTGL